MAKLNLDALKQKQEKLSSSGDLVSINKLGNSFNFRILPPLTSMNGVYYLERLEWWINKTPYVSPETLGEVDIIDEEVTAARDLGDPTINTLINSKDKIRLQRSYWIPVLLLKPQYGSRGEVTSCEVVDDKVKLLRVGGSVLKQLNAIILDPSNLNGSDEGIMDRVLGKNLKCTKSGEGLETRYAVSCWDYPLEMPEEYYHESAIPDPIERTKSQLYNDDFLQKVIRNYLYGEILPEKSDVFKRYTSKTKKVNVAPKVDIIGGGTKRVARKTSSAQRKAKKEAPSDVMEARSERNISSDLSGLDDD